jgi:preprotein translocase subunit SecB
MADEKTPAAAGAVGAQPGAQAQGVTLRVAAQYVKDLSFESPGAPGSLVAGAPAPQVEASVDVAARRMGDTEFECELRIKATAKRGEVTVFIVELVYGGLFQIANAPQDLLQPILLIECPRLLFPFARRVVADVTRDGGVVPLLLDPLDFAGLYRQQMAERAKQGAGDGKAADPVAPAGKA